MFIRPKRLMEYKPSHQRSNICALERRGRIGYPCEPAFNIAERTRSMRQGREGEKRAGNKLQ